MTGVQTCALPISYTILVTNEGPSDVVAADIDDTFPANITVTSVSALEAGGATVTANNTSLTAIDDTADLPANSSITYTVVADVNANATSSVINTATVDDDLDSDTDTDTDTINQVANLTITKTDGVSTVVPGNTTITYTILVTNDGPSDVVAANITDTDRKSVV